MRIYNKNIISIIFAGIFLCSCSSNNNNTDVAELTYARKPTPYYTVRSGDSVQSVACEFSMTVQELIEMNGLITPYSLIPGQKLIVHAKTRDAVKKNVFESYGISIRSQEEQKKDQLDPSGFAKTHTLEQQEVLNKDNQSAFENEATITNTNKALQKSEKETVDEESEEISSHGNLSWPVKGKIIRKFADKVDNEKSEGISISAPEGTPVYAAAPGTVLKSNEEIKGFGKAIVIQHDDGKKTVYLHLKMCNAKVGQKVDQKTVIGRVGKTGGLKKPQLHFQVRDANKKAINPQTLLK